MELSESKWSQISRYINSITLSTKLRYYQYRLLNKKLVLNIHHAKWDHEVSQMCTFCKERPETTINLLFECNQVRWIWLNLEKWCKQILGIQVHFTKELITYNNYRGASRDMINCIILITKQYVYALKCLLTPLNFIQMLTKVHEREFTERCIAHQKNKRYRHHKKWVIEC